MKEKDIRILLLETDNYVKEAMLNVLEEEGYTVTTVVSPHEAISLISTSAYEILITEIYFPSMKPLEFLEEIRKKSKLISIIIVTTKASSDLMPKLIKYEITDFLIKPVNISQILQALDRAYKRAKEKKELLNYKEKIETLERETQKLAKLLEESNSYISLGKMSRNVGHELKNILTALNLSLYYVEKKTQEKDLHLDKQFQLMKKGIEHGNSLLMELLGIGKQDKLSRYNLNQLIKESLALFEHDLKTKNIKLITDLSSILPEIEIYPNRIKQVFLNLILNTLEAMPKGGELRITSNVVTHNNKKYLQLEFRDTGTGIPQDKKNLIFDPSYTTKNSKGMGLGLFISKNIIEEHGGKIEVDSEKMRGTRFIIRFPIQLVDRIKVA